jgi:hypothetical protein
MSFFLVLFSLPLPVPLAGHGVPLEFLSGSLWQLAGFHWLNPQHPEKFPHFFKAAENR